MVFRGRAWKFGNDIDTDVIIPVQFTTGTDPNVFGKHCMEGIDPNFSEKVRRGDLIVAGTNFGCGSSREPAPLAIQAAGISCIIARSFARIFYRNAFNVGLPLLESATAPDDVDEADEIEVNIDSGHVRNLTQEKSFEANPIPAFMQELIRNGGLMKHIARKLELNRGKKPKK
jgi:3-isopropylmalate dehydratase small subunit